MISDYEISLIIKIVDKIRLDNPNFMFIPIGFKELNTNSDFDLFLVIHDNDVLNIVREIENIPPLLCIELPGDNSFFAQVTMNDLSWALDQYIVNDFGLDLRSLIKLETSEKRFYALNDIHVTSSAINKRLRYDIRVDEESLYNDGSDSANAILVCTPTGSTAMSFNLGGAIINPHSSVFQIISIASRNITTSHQIIPQNSEIAIEITEAILPLVINVDNYQFKTNDTYFSLTRAPFEIAFIKFSLRNSIRLQNKLKDKLSFEDTQSLTSTAKFLLHVLKNNDKPVSINELINTTHIRNQKTIRNALNLLISKGFVKRRENYTDMREYLYYYNLTEKGES